MREVFYGWRRKIGLMTLLMALALTAAWGRSLIVINRLSFQTGAYNSNRLASISGCVLWLRTFPADPANLSSSHEHEPELFAELTDGVVDWLLCEILIDEDKFEWNRRPFFGIQTGKYSHTQSSLGEVRASILKISYWSIIIPLTLCSALLLIVPLRRSIQKEDNKSVARESSI